MQYNNQVTELIDLALPWKQSIH